MTASLSGQTLIVAEPSMIARLSGEPLGRSVATAHQVTLDADAAIPEALLHDARVIVLEVDQNNDASLRRLASIRASHSDIAVIAALRQADVSLVRALIRQGVVDVTELPFVPSQLEEQLLDAWSVQTERQSTANLGQAISVTGATGGCGATSVLTHLAAELAKQNPGRRGVCLVDLDLQKGTAASYLGLAPVVTVQELLDAGSRLDRDLMLSAVTETDLGFGLIAAPAAISPVDRLDVDHLIATVKLIQSHFDFVLFDLPPMWTDWSLSVAGWSSQILLITDSAISSLNQAKRTLGLLSSVEVPDGRTGVVLNRSERGMFRTLRTPEVERALGADVLATISDAGASLRGAQDQGVLLSAVQGKNRFSADVAALAGSIVAGVALG